MSEPNKQVSALKFAEKKFIMTKTLHRNRNIFDIDEIDTFETIQQRRRRTPYKTLLHSELDEKLSENFLNSTTVNSFKVEQQIQKHKQKINCVNSKMQSRKNTKYIYFNSEADQEVAAVHEDFNKQIRGVSMDKMITREYRSSLDLKDNCNQVRFNNYSLMVPKGNIRPFQKYLSREQLEKLRVQTVPDSNPDIPIIYEKFAFNSSSFRVNWEYKRQKWPRGPIFYKLFKENSVNLYHIPEEKILQAQDKITAKWSKTETNFKRMSSKDDQCQFERTFYTPNMMFKPKKTYQKPVSKPIKKRQRKVCTQFERQELCDVKYFRLYPQTKGKQPRLHTK